MPDNRRGEADSSVKKLIEDLRKIMDPIKKNLDHVDQYIRYVPKINYNVDGTVSGYSYQTEYVERKNLSQLYFKVLPEFIKSDVYSHSLSLLSEIYRKPEGEIQPVLSSFLVNEISNGRKGNIDIFFDDLEGKPASLYLSAKMRGIVPEGTELILSNGIKLRRVREEDLTYEVPIYGLGHEGNLMSLPDSILAISLKTQNVIEVQTKIERLTILFSLYRETCAHYERYSIQTKSYSQIGDIIFFKNIQFSHEPKTTIRKSDLISLIAFINHFEPRITDALVQGKPIDPLEISLKRYLESIKESMSIEEKLTRAVMGLEALFLENESELKYRLALRVSQLLGYLNEDPLKVFEKVSEAYEYRSSHVHGSVLSTEKQWKVKEALDQIWRYLRKSILIWMAEDLSSEAKKRSFLKQIDSSLISEIARRLLKSKIDSRKTTLQGAI